MVWFKIDDKFHASEKNHACSAAAIGVWARAGSWCGDREKGNGFVPAHMLGAFGGTKKHGAELVAAGLWDVVEGGWAFHDWLVYNPSEEKIQADKAAAAERQRKWREKRKSQRDSGVTNDDVTDSETREFAFPVPDPVPASVTTNAVGSPNAPAGFAARVVTAYVEACRDAGVACPTDSQTRVERSARKLLADEFTEEAILDATRNAAVGGWTDLATQLQRDTARTSPVAAKGSTTDERVRTTLALAEHLDATEQKAITA